MRIKSGFGDYVIEVNIPPPPIYVNIPDLNYWRGYYNPYWLEIAQKRCVLCDQPIGYNQLAESTPKGYKHSPCRNTNDN